MDYIGMCCERVWFSLPPWIFFYCQSSKQAAQETEIHFKQVKRSFLLVVVGRFFSIFFFFFKVCCPLL